MAATPRRLARAEIFMIMMMEKNRSSIRSRGVVFDGDSRCVGCTQVKIMAMKSSEKVAKHGMRKECLALCKATVHRDPFVFPLLLKKP